jgi:hypothetical protein
LRAHVKSLEAIREVVGVSGDVLNKARCFDNDVKAGGEVSASKIIPVLVKFSMKMEGTLAEIRKLVPGTGVGAPVPESPVARSSGAEPSGSPVPTVAPSPHKERTRTFMVDLKTRLKERQLEEAIQQAAQIVVLGAERPSTAVSEASPRGKSKEPESRATSSELSARKSEKKKKRTPTPESEEEEEEESTAEDTSESAEEEVPSTPQPEPVPKRSLNTRSSTKKGPVPVYKTPLAPKCKTPGKGEGSNKKSKAN